MTIPTYGTLAISANQLVIGATFDIQKTVDNIPYIRVVSCSLINELILAQVENMGLFTIIVNTKYQVTVKKLLSFFSFTLIALIDRIKIFKILNECYLIII